MIGTENVHSLESTFGMNEKEQNMEREDSHQAKAIALSRDILMLSHSMLTVNFRFLDRALGNLKITENENVPFGSDGECLYYEPWYVLSQYKSESTAVNRGMMHTLLHCIFRHNFVGRGIDRARWDLACDITVEDIINGFHEPVLYSKKEEQQALTISMIKQEVGCLSSERIYKWLGDKGFSQEELQKQRQVFMGDYHGVWYGSGDSHAKTDKNVNLKLLWKEISRRMQTELETMQKGSGNALVQSLKQLNRTKNDYTAFLKRFGIQSEAMQINDQEYDINYYTYGIALYGNMPLIEPLEYQEQKRIRDFVIAVDTSGSVRGELVQSFIQHTYDILMSWESFFSKVNIHILQCDNEVREDAHITSREEFEEYIKHMDIKGLGRTDFRPVFTYVDELLKTGQMINLQGLLYFTDGRGIFPAQKPPYDVAFVLHTDGYEEPAVPQWAMHLILMEEDIIEGQFSAE